MQWDGWRGEHLGDGGGVGGRDFSLGKWCESKPREERTIRMESVATEELIPWPCWAKRSSPIPGAAAYVVENPQVFEYLVRGIGRLDVERRPAFVCTGGFISAAGVNLLDALSAAGYWVHYSGDFDRNGLAIAEWVLTRYPEARAWMMSVTDYHHALGDARPGDARRDLGDTCPDPRESPKRIPDEDLKWLGERRAGPLTATAHEIADRGVAAYQERLVEPMLSHLLGAAGSDAPS